MTLRLLGAAALLVAASARVDPLLEMQETLTRLQDQMAAFVADGGTETPALAPMATPAPAPNAAPSDAPTAAPSDAPTAAPSAAPTPAPTAAPTESPPDSFRVRLLAWMLVLAAATVMVARNRACLLALSESASERVRAVAERAWSEPTFDDGETESLARYPRNVA